jgi:ribosomal protein L11 methyltransferase
MLKALGSTNKKIDIEFIQKEIMMMVAASVSRLTPQSLEKIITQTFALDRTRSRQLIKDLIASGELEYTHEFGSTHLVLSFNKPVRISDHVVVKPPGHRFKSAPGDVVIRIQPGAAFGDGRHPTTRLSVRAIEYVLKTVRPKWLGADSSVLDIGTGSGILAMTAVRLGVKRGLAVDTDPNAVAEARENVVLNNLQDRLTISDRQIESIDASFSLVIANLRYPSLKNYYPQISKLTNTDGRVILSGFRPREQGDLTDLYTARSYRCIWTAAEIDWAATALKKM